MEGLAGGGWGTGAAADTRVLPALWALDTLLLTWSLSQLMASPPPLSAFLLSPSSPCHLPTPAPTCPCNSGMHRAIVVACCQLSILFFFLAQVLKPRPPVSSRCIICPWCIQLRQVQSGWYGTWVGTMGTAVGVPCCGAARGLGSSPAPSLVPE